jgi:ribosomal protein S12 methylthiotransferase accessory factor YcaO
LRLELAGWLADPEPRPFNWQSTHPSLLHHGDYPVNSAVAGAAIEALSGEGFRHRLFDAEDDPDLPVFAALQVMTTLWADELGARRNRAAGFGHAYEAL